MFCHFATIIGGRKLIKEHKQLTGQAAAPFTSPRDTRAASPEFFNASQWHSIGRRTSLFGRRGRPVFFLKQEIQSLVRVALGSSLADKVYTEQFQPFKYLKNSLLLTKRSTAVRTVIMSLSDFENDGFLTEQRSSESMQCIVTV
jgi:hypothetical protein